MLEVTQLVATRCCTVFTGAAVYINLVEHPARMGCDTRTATCTENAVAFDQPPMVSGRPIMSQSTYACMGCHQAR